MNSPAQAYRPEVLTPPPGPGVTPPFVAPPTDGMRKRRRIGLGVGAAALVVGLIGGVIGVGVLVITGADAQKTAATKVVTNYLTAWQRGDYVGAYHLLCPGGQQTITVDQLTSELDSDMLASFTLQPAQLATDVIYVPVDLTFTDGAVQDERFAVGSQSRTEPVACIER